jgi:hypothetical protein
MFSCVGTNLKLQGVALPQTSVPEDAPRAAQHSCALFPRVKATPDRHLLRALGDLHVLQQNLDSPVHSSETVHSAFTCVLDTVADQYGVQDLGLTGWVAQAETNTRK